MTEKEIFLGMVRRIWIEKGADEDLLRNYYYEDGNNVIVINANYEETTFYFDKNGALTYYD